MVKHLVEGSRPGTIPLRSQRRRPSPRPLEHEGSKVSKQNLNDNPQNGEEERAGERAFMTHTQSRPRPDIKDSLHLFLLQRRVIQPAPNRLHHHRVGQVEPIHLRLERSQLTALVGYMEK